MMKKHRIVLAAMLPALLTACAGGGYVAAGEGAPSAPVVAKSYGKLQRTDASSRDYFDVMSQKHETSVHYIYKELWAKESFAYGRIVEVAALPGRPRRSGAEIKEVAGCRDDNLPAGWMFVGAKVFSPNDGYGAIRKWEQKLLGEDQAVLERKCEALSVVDIAD